MSERKLEVDITRLFRSERLPVILQNEATECALACLAMVAAFHGNNLSLTELRRRFSASLRGTTLENAVHMADALGMVARPLRLELDELAQLQCPAILHWDLNHFVVLKKVRGDRVWIHDPSRGARCFTLSAIDSSFTGIALELSPTPTFEKKEKRDRARLSDFYASVRGLTPYIVQTTSLALIVQLFSIVTPILNQVIVDNVASNGDGAFINAAIIGMCILLVLNTVIGLLRGYVGLYVGTQLTFSMQSNLLRHAMKLPSSWFEKRHIGDIMSRFGSLSPVQTVISTAAANIILNSLMTISTLVMMAIYSPLLCAIEVALVLAFLVIRIVTFPYLRQKMDEGITLTAKVSTTFLETIRGSRAFKLFGMERGRLSVWQNEQMDATNNRVQLEKIGLWGGAGLGLLAGAQGILVWGIGIKAVISGDMTLGMLFAFQAYAAQFSSGTSGLIAQVFSIKSVELHLERVADIVHSKPEEGLDAPPTGKAIRGDITLHDVHFRYAEHEQAVIKGANIEIRSGDFACFVGPSGQGKTTLLKMLVGLHEPSEGRLLIDGLPIERFGIANYRAQIGAVLQDDQLFTGTIGENIAFFDPNMSAEQVEEAARLAHIHDEVMELPMGYRSLIGDMGSTLSGGQRQRVFLARALYRKPRILFLDEGTANLDTENEDRVMATLKALDITRIIIAHREAAMAGANRIFQVRKGHVIELTEDLDVNRVTDAPLGVV